MREQVPASFPINSVYQFSRGPEEAILRVSFRQGSGVRTDELQRRLRERFAAEFPTLRFSFEPSDIVSEVMSFGAAAPVEVAVRGGSLAENRDFAQRVCSRSCSGRVCCETCRLCSRWSIRRWT
jgi:hypothetical protein